MHRGEILRLKMQSSPHDLVMYFWLTAIGLSWLLGISVITDPPVGDGNIIRPFEQPISRFGPGHRGIDLSAVELDVVRSPISGVVHFAGYVVDRPLITISTGSILLTMEPVESIRSKGQHIQRGDVIGFVAAGGHCDQQCVHIGVRRINTRHYLDPLPYLLQIPRLLPAKP
jgi:murein DD-endopeptidase MepM/ murein hydrolase activator NlpD